MPIEIPLELRRPSQDEFGAIAFQVVGCAFRSHDLLGRLFREQSHKRLVARNFLDTKLEVPIIVRHQGFRKDYFIDMIVNHCAIFEWKAVDDLAKKHRAQLLNYMLLAELPHGKLINVGTELVQHEFVNTTLTRADRLRFEIDESEFRPLGIDDQRWHDFLLSAIHDWGVGLDVGLYEDAITFCCGGRDSVIQDVEVYVDGIPAGFQSVRTTPTGAAFKVTAYPVRNPAFAHHAARLLEFTSLPALHWINVDLKGLTIKTLLPDDV